MNKNAERGMDPDPLHREKHIASLFIKKNAFNPKKPEGQQ
jgi:hypothetical protein